jgi:hypothetical protein
MKASDDRAVGRKVGVQDLDGDRTLDPALKSAVDTAGGTDANELLDPNLSSELDADERVVRLGRGGAERRAVLWAKKHVSAVIRATNRADIARLPHREAEA